VVEYELGATTIGVGCHPAWKPSRDGTTVAFEVDDMDATISKLKERGVTFDMEKPKRRFAGWRSFGIPTGTNWSCTKGNNDEARMSNDEGMIK